jgi:hypothetical protein
MARIVAVHGIAQQFEGEYTLAAAWLPALRSGLSLAGGSLDDDKDFGMAFYGDLFREAGKAVLPPYQPEDIADPWECQLLEAWWEEAARVDENVPSPSDRGKARTPGFVQGALAALSQSKFFGGLAERALIGDLKQVYQYMNDAAKRSQIQARLAARVGPDTRVVVAHSLGSIVAYEVLAAHPEWHVDTLVTLGSPLGIRNLIFDMLRPPPKDGVGAWPGRIAHWVNIADRGDIVALSKKLSSLFGARVVDHPVHNGATAHNVAPYLTAIETGQAIRMGLGG